MKFFGELLIFILLFVINIRVFFLKSGKRDPVVALAPLAFIMSIFQVFSWGIDLFTALGVILSFLVLVFNFHALFRYSENLYVDNYSTLMKCCSLFTNILSIGAVLCLILFMPMDIRGESIGVIEKKSRYTGNFKTGIEPAGVFNRVSAVLYEFCPKENLLNEKKQTEKDEDTEDIVLFIPDKRGDTNHYKPFLKLLAAKGYHVFSADFFTNDCKWFYSGWDFKAFRRISMVTYSLKMPQRFSINRELYTYNIAKECDELLKILKDRYNYKCRIFVISDVMSNDAVSNFVNSNKEYITGHFELDSIEEYKTAGYGCITQTAPVLSSAMGILREFRFETARLLAEKAQEAVVFE